MRGPAIRSTARAVVARAESTIEAPRASATGDATTGTPTWLAVAPVAAATAVVRVARGRVDDQQQVRSVPRMARRIRSRRSAFGYRPARRPGS